MFEALKKRKKEKKRSQGKGKVWYLKNLNSNPSSATYWL